MVKKGKNNMFDELIKNCIEKIKRYIENDGYVGLIAVKNKINKDIFYNKFNKLDCRIDENRIQFDNGSYIFILNENQLEYYRGYKYNYVIIDSNVEKVYKDNFIYPKLVPYRDNDGNILYESVVEYF